MRPLCVIGLGLIGGSVLRAAAAAGIPAFGATASQADASAARSEGFQVHSVTEALHEARTRDALVCLAVPLPAVDEVLRAVAAAAPVARLTDVASVKASVRSAVARHAPHARYIGGHPMVGTAESGWRAGSATLLGGANWVVCPGDDLEVWRDVAELALQCGARALPMDAERHDAAVARVSHLPHLLAAVLAAVGAADGPLPLQLAAGSFNDGTRVAGTRPELVRAMCEGNAEALVPVLDTALEQLHAARETLASRDELETLAEAGHRGRRALQRLRSGHGAELTTELTAATLTGLAQRGGVVTRLDGDTVTARLPD